MRVSWWQLDRPLRSYVQTTAAGSIACGHDHGTEIIRRHVAVAQHMQEDLLQIFIVRYVEVYKGNNANISYHKFKSLHFICSKHAVINNIVESTCVPNLSTCTK